MACERILLKILLSFYLNQLLSVAATDNWNGIRCYAETKAKDKICNSCVTIYNDYSIVKRDCYEALDQQEQRACESGGDVKCDRCFTEYCNRGHPSHQCSTCDSRTDNNCLNDVLSLNVTQCVYDSNGLDDFYCFVKWNKTSGDIERGCVATTSDYSDCLHRRSTCQMCIANDSDACNAVEYPENRRKCVNCDSDFDVCPPANELSRFSFYCQIPNDFCVTVNRGPNNFTLSCAQEMSESDQSLCNADPSRCKFCNNENDCNGGQFDQIEATTEGTTENIPAEPGTDSSEDVSRDAITSWPSSGHQCYGNCILLVVFIIVSVIMS